MADYRSGNRKRKHTSLLDLLNGQSEAVKNDAQVDQIINSILVKTPAGEIISLEVNGTDTIGSIKLKIQTQESLPFDQHELIFDGTILEDMNTIAKLCIKNCSTLTLVRKSPFNLEIKNLEGTIMFAYLDVKSTDTIASVKLKIKMIEGISVDEQVLIFNKMVLADNSTLFDFNIQNKSTLTLIRKSRGFMKIFIKTPNGGTITEEVKPWHIISSIKTKIQDQVHVSFADQEFIFNEMVLFNLNTFAECNIKHESTITLRRISRGVMQIYVKTLAGTTLILDAKPLDTVYSIISKIHDKLGIHHVNIPSDKQELIFEDMVLHNMDTLDDYNIKRGSTLTLVSISSAVMQIFIKNPGTGKTFTLEVRRSDTIRNVKDKIFDKEDHDPRFQRLYFNKLLLKDEVTVAVYQIHKESTIHLYTY